MKESVTKFDFDTAFKALDEIPIPKVGGIRPNRSDLHESVRRADRTSTLIEEYFDVQNPEELNNAQEEIDADVARAKLARIEKIVDLDATSEEDIQPSYVGKVIIQCPQCMTLFYKKPEDIERSDESEDTVNIGEECQHCGNTSGYTIIGKVAEETLEDEAPVEEETVEETEEEVPVEEEQPEETEEEQPEEDEMVEAEEEVELPPVEGEEEEKEEEVKESLQLHEAKKDGVVVAITCSGKGPKQEIDDAILSRFTDILKPPFSAKDVEKINSADKKGLAILVDLTGNKEIDDAILSRIPYKVDICSPDVNKYLFKKLDTSTYSNLNETLAADFTHDPITAIKKFVEKKDFDDLYEFCINIDKVDEEDIEDFAHSLTVIGAILEKYKVDEWINNAKNENLTEALTKTYYKLEGRSPDGYQRYIIFGQSGNPIIGSRWEVQVNRWVLFETPQDAQHFLDRMGANNQKIIDYGFKPTKWNAQAYTKDLYSVDPVTTNYGDCVRARVDYEHSSRNTTSNNNNDNAEPTGQIRREGSAYDVNTGKSYNYSWLEDSKLDECDIKECDMKEDYKSAKTLELAAEEMANESLKEARGKSDWDVSKSSIRSLLNDPMFLAPLREDADIEINELEELDEDSFDTVINEYLTKNYSNILFFEATDTNIKDNKLIVEGYILFKSKKTKPTSFVFEKKNNKIVGYNKTLAEGYAFELNGRVKNKKLITEKLNYKYNAGKKLVEGFVHMPRG